MTLIKLANLNTQTIARIKSIKLLAAIGVFIAANSLTSAVVYSFLHAFAERSLTSGDWHYYSKVNYLQSPYNGAFAIIIQALGVKSPISAASIIIAKITTVAGFALLVLFFEKRISCHNQESKNNRVILFALILGFNPYFNIASFKLSTETFIYAGVGVIYLLIDNIKKHHETGQKVKYTALLLLILSIIISIRNILLISLPLLGFYAAKNTITSFLANLNKNKTAIWIDSNNWLNICRITKSKLRNMSAESKIFIILFCIIMLINGAMFASFIPLYLKSRNSITSALEKTRVDTRKVHYKSLNASYFGDKLLSLISNRETIGMGQNIDKREFEGVVTSNNVFLTNIMPKLVYTIFNTLGIIFCIANKKLRVPFLITVPMVLPVLVGVSHMRYLYPLVPLICMGWTLTLYSFYNYFKGFVSSNF